MKFFLVVLLGLFFTNCNSPKIVYSDSLCKPVLEHQKSKFLDALDAKDAKYSVIIFTSVFEGEHILVTNGNDTLYDAPIKDIGNGFSKGIRINNNYDVKISDIEKSYSFVLQSENLKDHKYVYVKKDMFKKNRQYMVTYSNTLCGFK